MGRSGPKSPPAGVYAALVTPRIPNSTEANVAVFLEYIDRICGARVDGIVLFGSTGEFIHYDREERMRVVSLAVKRSRVPALVNVSHSSLQGAVELAQQAETAGAAGVLLMPPYFYRYAAADIEQFYFEFLNQAALRLPVYLYNLPICTNPLSPGSLTRLLGSGRFAGIKDSSGDWASFAHILEIKQTVPIQAFTGHEPHAEQVLRSGGDGLISGIAAALPEIIVDMWHAPSSGLEQKITEFMAWVPQFPPSVAIKHTADCRGWLPAQFAVPLGLETSRRLSEFRSWLMTWLPDVRT